MFVYSAIARDCLVRFWWNLEHIFMKSRHVDPWNLRSQSLSEVHSSQNHLYYYLKSSFQSWILSDILGLGVGGCRILTGCELLTTRILIVRKSQDLTRIMNPLICDRVDYNLLILSLSSTRCSLNVEYKTLLSFL
jgi:hypothetical protein